MSPSPHPGLPAAVAAYRYALHCGSDAHQRLRDALTLLPAAMDGAADHVGVLARGYGGSGIEAASDDTARVGDALQHLLDEGPMLQSLRTGHTVLVDDLRRRARWPHWCDRAAAELRIATALAVPLRFNGRQVGALTLYARRPCAASDIDLAQVHTLANPLTTVLVEARLDANRWGRAA